MVWAGIKLALPITPFSIRLVHNVKKIVKRVLAGSVNLPDKYSGLAHMATLRYREEVPILVPA